MHAGQERWAAQGTAAAGGGAAAALPAWHLSPGCTSSLAHGSQVHTLSGSV